MESTKKLTMVCGQCNGNSNVSYFFSQGFGEPFICPECLLTKQDTRELLQWLNKARKCGQGGYDPFNDGNGYCFSVELLKNELSKREHVPNKKEAKKIRQEKAKKR
jgi:hypothetical protein